MNCENKEVNNTTKYLFYFEGNIGAGKSSIINNLYAFASNLNNNIDVLYEPIDEWCLLDVFYEDKSKAFLFQLDILNTKFKQIFNSLDKNDILFIEREMISGLDIFSSMLYKNNWITKEEMDILNFVFVSYYTLLNEKYKLFSTVFYIKCSPEICMNRIKQRGRLCEIEMEINYLNDLCTEHENKYNKLANNIDYFPIDNNGDDLNNACDEIKKIINKIYPL